MIKKRLSELENIPFYKRSKHIEKFSREKYKKSIIAAGLGEQDTEEVCREVKVDPHRYFTSAKLHRATYKALLKKSALVAANYDIPRSIHALGPTGFPFEILCAQMLKAKGFETEVGIMMQGEFISHEVDIIARRDDLNLFCEVKFHNKKVYKNDVKVALYVYARYLDLKRGNPEEQFEYVLISNTQFSKDAITFSEGVGLILISLNHPHKDTFIDHIRKYKIYPITVLKSLRKKSHQELLERKIVTVKQLKRVDLVDIGLDENIVTKVMQEVKVLTRPD